SPSKSSRSSSSSARTSWKVLVKRQSVTHRGTTASASPGVRRFTPPRDSRAAILSVVTAWRNSSEVIRGSTFARHSGVDCCAYVRLDKLLIEAMRITLKLKGEMIMKVRNVLLKVVTVVAFATILLVAAAFLDRDHVSAVPATDP